jgi:hypothetical protein
MGEILVLIEKNQTWIYILLSLSGLIYLRLVIKRYRELQCTFFGLERERARSVLYQSLVMLGMILGGFILIFFLTTFVSPTVPLAARPTVLPTVSLLDTPVGTSAEDIAEPTATSIAGSEMPSGCANPDATITSPREGASISGLVEVGGTANIPGFAFYKVEVKSLSPDAIWRAIGAGTDPVCDADCSGGEILARWDSSLVTPGEYTFRLTVMDTAGNAPLPCEVSVSVLPSE